MRQSAITRNLKRKKNLMFSFKNSGHLSRDFFCTSRIKKVFGEWEGGGKILVGRILKEICAETFNPVFLWGNGKEEVCLNQPSPLKPWHSHFESLRCVAWSLRNDKLPQKICRAGEKLVSCVEGVGIKAGNSLVWKTTLSLPVAGHKGAENLGPALLKLF